MILGFYILALGPVIQCSYWTRKTGKSWKNKVAGEFFLFLQKNMKSFYLRTLGLSYWPKFFMIFTWKICDYHFFLSNNIWRKMLKVGREIYIQVWKSLGTFFQNFHGSPVWLHLDQCIYSSVKINLASLGKCIPEDCSSYK